MKEFFQVKSIEEVLAFAEGFPPRAQARVPLASAHGRVLAEDLFCREDLPGYARSTMDGFAVPAASTFGASNSNPSLFSVVGHVVMGQAPDISLGPGQAAGIATGGMLPKGANAVVMVEHTESLDAETLEAYKAVAPLANVIAPGDNFRKGERMLEAGTCLRAQEMALLAAAGQMEVPVFERPVAAILSTGDEIVPPGQAPGPGKLRDMNAHALTGQCLDAGAAPRALGIVQDDPDALFAACQSALDQSDTLLISGGSSVGARDYTIEAISRFPGARVLVHGVSISPGKPTILARVHDKPVWGLPGHVVSAMIVFEVLVRPFLRRMSGAAPGDAGRFYVPARLTRNVPGKQGRVDYVRVRLVTEGSEILAEPIFGKSGEIRTMVRADGILELGINDEGLDAGSLVRVRPF